MTDPVVVRRRLRAVGRRREKADAAKRAVVEETRAALLEARGVISIAEAARLAGIARPVVYEVYGGARRDGKSN